MKEIWTLIIKTSLPKTTDEDGITGLSTEVRTFETFEKAKKVLREKFKEYAFNKNSMFDGKGNLTYLNSYINGCMDEDDEYEDEDVLTQSKLNSVQDALKGILAGKDEELKIEEIDYITDWMISLQIKRNSISLYGDAEGPCNGYNPHIKSNMFDMREENNYYLYIDDMFGQDDNSSELYIDLIKTTLE